MILVNLYGGSIALRNQCFSLIARGLNVFCHIVNNHVSAALVLHSEQKLLQIYYNLESSETDLFQKCSVEVLLCAFSTDGISKSRL